MRIAEAEELFVVGGRDFGAELLQFPGDRRAIETGDGEAAMIDARLLAAGREFETETRVAGPEPDAGGFGAAPFFHPEKFPIEHGGALEIGNEQHDVIQPDGMHGGGLERNASAGNDRAGKSAWNIQEL